MLPGVMGIEAFAEAALSVFPGWRVEAVEDVDFLAPFKFYRHEPRTVTIEALFRPDGDGRGRGMPVDRPAGAAEPDGAAEYYAFHGPRAADQGRPARHARSAAAVSLP